MQLTVNPGHFTDGRTGPTLAHPLKEGREEDANVMTCPYLTEVTMVFCQASPQKKLIPSDRISTASACEGDGFSACALYREALARALHTIEELETELHDATAKKGA
jgi:hypothetical protein